MADHRWTTSYLLWIKEHVCFRAFLLDGVRIIIGHLRLHKLVSIGLKLSRLIRSRDLTPLLILGGNILLNSRSILNMNAIRLSLSNSHLPRILLTLLHLLLLWYPSLSQSKRSNATSIRSSLRSRVLQPPRLSLITIPRPRLLCNSIVLS